MTQFIAQQIEGLKEGQNIKVTLKGEKGGRTNNVKGIVVINNEDRSLQTTNQGKIPLLTTNVKVIQKY